ncbi:IclR family transcriptional regulator [Pseudoclavibacter endophyticus]|nr:IclR family transcriptional regulator [Pseudoclavibacter endophyticus]
MLDAFDALNPTRTLTEITRVTGMPHSTAHRIVGELVRERLLERGPERTYRLGLRLWEYGARTPGVVGLREAAQPWIAAANSRLRQHVQLGVRVDTDVLFIERMSANDSVVNASLVGGRVPLHASSSGLVLLAFGHRSIVEDVIATGMRRLTPHTIVEEGELRRTLRRIRNDGFGVTHGHIHLESMGVAVPVYGADGVVSASMGAVVKNTEGTPMAVIEILNVAAAGMTRTLQQQGGQPSLGPPGSGNVSQRSWEVIETVHRSRADRASRGTAGGR